jgi:ectoine hydroxylase-related dioxygenase (phytanoyl-CoA dioxygenase family)
MDTRPTNTRDSLPHAKRDHTPWASLSLPQQIKSIELEGYVVFPSILSPDLISAIKAEVDQLPTNPTDYSQNQRSCTDLYFRDLPHTHTLMTHPVILSFLNSLLGDDLICTSFTYALSRAGHPGIAIHTDSQPYGSKIFGVEASSPCLVRVLFYLDDLTPQRSPLKVIPRSHLSMHKDGMPYNRYLNHPDEIMVTLPPGSAAIINQKVFHANYPNFSSEDRRLVAVAFRPAWAGPIAQVNERDESKIAALPPQMRALMGPLNTRRINFDLPNRPADLKENATGISPARWGN